MLLEKLREYAARRHQEAQPPMYEQKTVHWLIELDTQGRFAGFTPLTEAVSTKRGTRERKGRKWVVPTAGRHAGGAYKWPCLLVGSSEFVLGIRNPTKKQDHSQEAHTGFVDEVRACAEELDHPVMRAVFEFLHNPSVALSKLPPDFAHGDVITFRVGDTIPVDLPEVQNYWGERAREKHIGEEVIRMQCVVCGETKPVCERLPTAIKGIPGGQTSGTAVISANKAAYESYGLEASLIAPICVDCAEAFTNALNTLIAGEDTSLKIGNSAAYVFWTEEERRFSPARFFSEPDPDEVRALIHSVYTGKDRSKLIDPEPFFAAALSGSGGRAVVRDWIDTSVGHVKRNLAHYFKLHRLIDAWGNEGRPLGVYSLAAATVRDMKDLQANTVKAIVRSGLTGTLLPSYLLSQALKRVCVESSDRKFPHNRAVLIKMIIAQNSNVEGYMEQLDSQNQDPAYLCGRLFAVLEQIQRAALGDVGSTIVDRFYGTASSAPASVFGNLLRGSQSHLGKLRKGKPASYHALQQRLETISGSLAAFPRTLKMQDQGLFSLGYYHQRAEDRAAARARKEAAATRASEGKSNSEE